MKTLTLKLTDKEIECLRNSTSDLGSYGVSLQLKIANAILDAESNANLEDWRARHR